ncbi:MAG: hypothetical protein KatS3mg089_0986 [Patescibacteria group bacterium]|nr:MAG: hypothetical protein KatS3mg089_0986 [Patescibacteria group bacterium]
MRKLLTIIVYTFIMLLVGRNLVILPRFVLFTSPHAIKTDLKKETERIIADKKGNYGVYFADFTTGETFGINEEEMFTAASLNKVPIVAVLYYLENKGKIDLDEQITLQKEDIQDYGTGSLRYQKPGTTYSLKTLAKLALKQSDNTAAYILSQKIGTPVIQKIINQWGLTQTNMEENQTSPKDMYILFAKIFNNEVTTQDKTKELLGFMRETDIEDRLPAKLPSSATVYHKTGDALGNLHDVGIITEGNTIFFLGVMTSDIGAQEKATKDTIATIAKKTLDYYLKRR